MKAKVGGDEKTRQRGKRDYRKQGKVGGGTRTRENTTDRSKREVSLKYHMMSKSSSQDESFSLACFTEKNVKTPATNISLFMNRMIKGTMWNVSYSSHH